MSTADLLTKLAPEFDRPAMPRAEFVDGLWSQLELELRLRVVKNGVSGRTWRPSSLRSWLTPVVRSPRRVALVLAIVLLLLSGVAMATYLGVRPWVSSSPRGAQVTADFSLSSVYRAPPSMWMDHFTAQALSADGHTLYLVHRSSNTELLAIRGIDTGHPGPARTIFDFSAVPDRLFSRGPAWDGLAAAPGGDVFAVGASGSRDPLAASVIVIRPDGSHQIVATYAQLVRQGVLPRGIRDWASDDGSFSIVASDRDRLWLRATTLHTPYAKGWPYDVTQTLVEIVDPNGDGDWSDRVARRVVLPRSVPGFQGRSRSSWWLGRLVAEPSLPGADGSHSVLLQMTGLHGYGSANPRFESRVYRVSDRNDDGDALDSGEVTLLYRGARAAGLAERLATSGGHIRRQLVLTGATRSDRITLVPEHGSPVDIGRSFPGFSFTNVFTGPRGDIYPVFEYDQAANGTQLRVYRLARGGGMTSPARTRQPAAVVGPSNALPSLLLTKSSGGAGTSAAWTKWIRPDTLHVLDRAPRVGDVCRATSGRLLFRSDVAVPREPFVYVDDPGSAAPRKITEQDVTPVCPFDGRFAVLSSRTELPDGPAWSLVRHDVRTGRETTLIGYTPRFEVSPDGHRVVYVLRTREAESLVLLDVRTLRRRTLAGPLHGASYAPSTRYPSAYNGVGGDDLVWSSDGKQVAFVTGRGFDTDPSAVAPARAYAIWVAGVGTSPRRLTTLSGGPPTVAWSPDGSRLLICNAEHGPSTGCGNHTEVDPGVQTSNASVLRVVGVARGGHGRVLARGSILFAGWNPTGNGFAWSDWLWLHLADGRRILVNPSAGNWVGWSPDGRFIALGPRDRYAVLDLASGRVRPLVGSSLEYMVQEVRWWR